MAILSDAQEVLERGHLGCDNHARQLINRAKHFLIEQRNTPPPVGDTTLSVAQGNCAVRVVRACAASNSK